MTNKYFAKEVFNVFFDVKNHLIHITLKSQQHHFPNKMLITKTIVRTFGYGLPTQAEDQFPRREDRRRARGTNHLSDERAKGGKGLWDVRTSICSLFEI